VNTADLKYLIGRVINSEVYKRWNKKDHYLVNCFFFNDRQNVSFYSKTTKKITTFNIGDEVEIWAGEDVFQEKKEDLEELKIEDVNISLSNAGILADKIKIEKLADEKVALKIFILQQKAIPFWNVTYTTSAFNIFNVKINATNGEIIDESVSSFMDLRKTL